MSALRLIAAEALTRDGARSEAKDELSRAVYDEAKPSLVVRALNWMIEHVQDLLSRASSATPGGVYGLLTAVAILALAVVVVVRLGSLRPPESAGDGLDAPAAVTADQLRSEAEQLARDGRFADAVRARLRAVVRTLEDRALIEPRPGRTATEVARDAGAVVPTLRPALDAAAGTFSEVWYGGRTASAEDYRVVGDLDDALRRHRPTPAPASSPTGPPVPA
ncbi:MAG: hypothetical protein QOC80_1084 [Frankiaceae bacterium]|nr:hypothetical protein [Frankiaceae bacterium]